MRLQSTTMIVADRPAATAPAAMATETDTAIDPLPDATITMTDGVIGPLPAAVPLMTTLLRGEVVTRSRTVQPASTLPTRMSMAGSPMTVVHPHRTFLPVTDTLVRDIPLVITSRVAPTRSSRRRRVVLLHWKPPPRPGYSARTAHRTITRVAPRILSVRIITVRLLQRASISMLEVQYLDHGGRGLSGSAMVFWIS